ncbi:MAG: 1-acyl-sn-glycerol-3-phosphate acyltransferase [Saprospiraceae bacterium]|nr:1-acyl-sn-glycerol-3-phosphate acyltransferase [Saprospiraceae bacterium]
MNLYFFIRPFVRFGLKLYFKNIFIAGLNKIPSDKSIIIASNHPTAFFEPILLACLHSRSFNFLTRGDIFKKAFYHNLLSKLHMIPIFRFRDGHENMKKNQEIFNLCNQKLSDNQALVIFPEGHLSTGIGLDKLQKGTARMAFSALQNNPSIDLYIIPVTYYYSNPHHYRGDAFVECSKSIHVNSYFEAYKEHDALTINKLTAQLEEAMAEKVITIADDKYKTMVRSILKMYRNEFFIKRNEVIFKDRQIYQNSRLISNNFLELDTNQKEALFMSFQDLEKEAATTNYDIHYPKSNSSKIKLFFAIIMGFIPFLIGYLNLFPLKIAKSYTQKKIDEKAFFGPVLFGTSMIVWFFYYVLWVIVSFLVQNLFLHLYVILLPFITYYSIYYYDFIKFEINSLHINSIIESKRSEFMTKIDNLLV